MRSVRALLKHAVVFSPLWFSFHNSKLYLWSMSPTERLWTDGIWSNVSMLSPWHLSYNPRGCKLILREKKYNKIFQLKINLVTFMPVMSQLFWTHRIPNPLVFTFSLSTNVLQRLLGYKDCCLCDIFISVLVVLSTINGLIGHTQCCAPRASDRQYLWTEERYPFSTHAARIHYWHLTALFNSHELTLYSFGRGEVRALILFLIHFYSSCEFLLCAVFSSAKTKRAPAVVQGSFRKWRKKGHCERTHAVIARKRGGGALVGIRVITDYVPDTQEDTRSCPASV